MSSSKFTTVAQTTAHIEFAVKWADACVREVLGDDFTWSSRKIMTTGLHKGGYTTLEERHLYPIKGEVQVSGKIDSKKIAISVELLGMEDLDHPKAVWRQDDVSGPQSLIIKDISIAVEEKSGKRSFRKFDIDHIPGHTPFHDIKLVEDAA